MEEDKTMYTLVTEKQQNFGNSVFLSITDPTKDV